MKKDLLIVPTYIAVTLFLTAFAAIFFVLYPMPSIGTLEYHIYAWDVFLYSALSLLPLVAVAALAAMILRSIKYNSSSTLDFFTYIFLCVFVWLMLIPFCLFFSPEQVVSFKLTGQAPSMAHGFFNVSLLSNLLQNLELYSITIPNSLVVIFSDLLLLRETAFLAGRVGRIDYLLYSSLGLALSSLYALRFVSKWKLINVAAVLFIWCVIIWINGIFYRQGWVLLINIQWTVCLINCLISVIVFFVGGVSSAKNKDHKKEGE